MKKRLVNLFLLFLIMIILQTDNSPQELELGQQTAEIPSAEIPFSLENGEIKFNFLYTPTKIDLQSVTNKDSSHTFDVYGILWRIRLIDLNSAPAYNELTKTQDDLNCYTSYNIQQDGASQILYMNWADCAVDSTNTFNLTISVRLDQDSDFSNWRVSINNDMNDYSILYAKLSFGILKNPDDYAVINNEQVKNPANMITFSGSPYIDGGGVALNLKIVPYWTSNNQGLYFMSKDSLPPHYQLNTFTADGQRFVYGHGFYPEYIGTPGNDLSMDYDFSIGVFNGDWYDAARLYRNWALSQPWANTKLINRNDIPTFWRELDLGEASQCPYPNLPGCQNVNLTYEIESWKKVRDFYNLTNLVVFYWFGLTPPPDFSPYPWTETLTNGLENLGIKTFVYANPQ
ncbi:MAG: DUF6259 domain-containing protein, partial [Nanoarchaeota archaeon]